MARYEIIIYWSDEDQSFIAEVPELPGCAADGGTYQEALANVEVVIAEWTETAKELGRPIPKPKGRLMSNSIPEGVRKRIAHLRDTHDAHLKVVHRMLEANNRRLFGLDLVVMGVIYRSLSLIDGFTYMVEKQNVLCAGALLRLQVDSILRLYACWLVNDPHSLIQPLLEGNPLNKIKSRDGKRLTDKYLWTEVSKLYPWVNSVYEHTSRFVHLSLPHMIAPVTDIDDSSRTLSMVIGSQGREWKENEMIEAVDAFIEATKSILHLAASWIETKRKAAAKRDSCDA